MTAETLGPRGRSAQANESLNPEEKASKAASLVRLLEFAQGLGRITSRAACGNWRRNAQGPKDETATNN